MNNFRDSMKVDTNEEKARKIIRGIDESLQQKTYKNINQRDDLVVHIRENQYGARKVVQAQFKTFGCRMKKAGSCWNCNYGVTDKCLITPKRYISEFSKVLENVNGDALVLESLGSITDKQEFPEETLKDVINIAVESDKFGTIIVETHISQIHEDLAQYIQSVNKFNKNIVFEVGIEDINPENRKFINKLGVDNKKIHEAYEMLQKYNMTLGINLIYGFPFMTEQQRIESTMNSIKYISENLTNSEIVIFLMSVKENTIMEMMQQQGIFKMPNPWGLVELTKKILEQTPDDLVTFSWFGEKEDPYIKEKKAYNCKDCEQLIIEFFRKINETFNPEERKKLLYELFEDADNLECGCHKKFAEQLQIEDNEIPAINRYNEFINKIAKKEIEEI